MRAHLRTLRSIAPSQAHTHSQALNNPTEIPCATLVAPHSRAVLSFGRALLTCAKISVKRGPVPATAASLCRLLLSATDPRLSTCPTAAPGRSRCAMANSRSSPPTCAQARARAASFF